MKLSPRHAGSALCKLALVSGFCAGVGGVSACSETGVSQAPPTQDSGPIDALSNDTRSVNDVAPADLGVDAAPDVATVDVQPDVAVDAAPDVALDATPDVALDAVPDVAVDAAPDVAVDATPDVAVDATPDVAVDATPDVAALDATPDVPFRCATAADCSGNPAGAACDAVSGRCVQCIASTDTCPAAQHCDDATHACVAGCRSDEGCAGDGGPGGRCDTATHACVACVTSAHCPLGMLCTGNVCAAGCDAMHGCPGEQSCCAGACVDTRGSVGHCGACGARCTAANATPACVSSVCAVGVCATGFGDCDATASNGCETDTRTATAHCGACGNACAAPHGTPACAAGACGISRCDAGFGDCDRLASNGCEADLSSSAAHCGACGTVCPSGVSTCILGRCAPGAAIVSDVNLSTDPIAPGRTCAAGISWGVSALSATAATVSEAVPAGCLAEGDSVLLINLQGAPGATANVGNYEVLTVSSVAGATVNFREAHVRSYGSASGSDANIGAGAGQQRVVLQRVPMFGDLAVSAGATMTVDAWNGTRGGVLAFRAARVSLAGSLSAVAVGYRSGAFSVDDGSCSDNIDTEGGESIQGPPSVTILASAGASGGLNGTGGSFHSNTPLQPSAGHATAGEPGGNPVGRTLGAPGGTYGVPDGSRLTLGSGAGGNLTCRGGSFGPFLSERSTVAGGIVLVWANDISLAASGRINASGSDGSRTAASGGYVMLRALSLSLGAAQVLARGSEGTSTTSGGVITNRGGDGYISLVYRDAATGTTAPAANRRVATDPFAP